jgi:DNA repair exonuclease SbcCD ATPase subunit
MPTKKQLQEENKKCIDELAEAINVVKLMSEAEKLNLDLQMKMALDFEKLEEENKKLKKDDESVRSELYDFWKIHINSDEHRFLPKLQDGSLPLAFLLKKMKQRHEREIKMKLNDYWRGEERIKKLKEEIVELREDNEKLKSGIDELFDNNATASKQIEDLKEELNDYENSCGRYDFDPLLSQKKLCEIVEEWEKGNCHLHLEIEKLKDFTNWENHPALKYKVVLDEDYWLAHSDMGELIDPDDYNKLKEEIEELKYQIKELKEKNEKHNAGGFCGPERDQLVEDNKDLLEQIEEYHREAENNS